VAHRALSARLATPAFIDPMQAKLVPKLPEGAQWLYETKLDGYRAIAIKDAERVEIRSRNNKDLTAA
jgi:bifunctional non-homologous end joining protein LigD